MPRNKSPQDPEGGFDELERLAQELNLTALRAHLRDALAEAERRAPSFTNFVLDLLRWERDARQERRLNRNLKRSRLENVEGLDGYDFDIRPKLEARVVRELLACRWAAERRNVICVGRPGLGKTRIVKALAHAACQQGHTVLYVNTAEMLEDLQGSLADGTYRRTFRRYAKPSVLCLEEFGYEPFDALATNHLFRVVSARHGAAATVIVANTGFRHWKRFFPSEAQAVATVDRLIDRATILRFSGNGSRGPKEVYGADLDE
jgi:DNA replication protein DnaC